MMNSANIELQEKPNGVPSPAKNEANSSTFSESGSQKSSDDVNTMIHHDASHHDDDHAQHKEDSQLIDSDGHLLTTHLDEHHVDHKDFGALGCVLKYNLHTPKHDVHIPHHGHGLVMWNNLSQKVHDLRMRRKQHKLAVKEAKQAGIELNHELNHITAPTPHIIIRLLTLFLLFALVFGPAMGYSSVGALTEEIKAKYKLSDKKLGALFSVYSLPNIFAVFIAGVCVDKFGANIVGAICAAMFVTGQLIAIIPSYYSLLIGRIIYGVGSECVGIVQSAIVAKWFTHDSVISLALANAICLLGFRASGFVMMFAIPPIGQSAGLIPAQSTVSAINVLSGICAVALIILNYKYRHYLSHDSSKAPPLKLLDIIRLPIPFWIIAALTLLFYGSVLSFVSFANSYVINKWDFSARNASFVTSMIYGVATLVMVPFGLFIDRLGHRLTLMLCSIGLVVFAYILLVFTHVTPWVGCALLGVAFGTVPCAVWPTIPLIVDEAHLGIAYGILTGMLNGALFLVPFVVGYISKDYYKALTLFILSGVCLLVCVVLILFDVFFCKARLELSCIRMSRDTKHLELKDSHEDLGKMTNKPTPATPSETTDRGYTPSPTVMAVDESKVPLSKQ